MRLRTLPRIVATRACGDHEQSHRARPIRLARSRESDGTLDAWLRPRYLMAAMDEWFRTRLKELEDAGLLRDPDDSREHDKVPTDGEPWLDACSNDYLGLGSYPVSRETMDRVMGARMGAGAARLVQGTFHEHADLECELAKWLGREACWLTASAFAANVGVIPALADAEALVISDSLNHASIVDGCRLARARVVVTPHLELEPIESALRGHRGRSPAWVVTEGLFSMDGDSPNLEELRGLCDRYEAGLMVDEAHSLGVLGPSGGGVASLPKARADVVVAGLGKAVGAHGGVVAGSEQLARWLWNRARSFVFSTALSPAFCRLVLEQVRMARAAESARARLKSLGDELRTALARRGFATARGCIGPIVPVVLGSNERAMRAMRGLRERGILAQAIRPPTVPPDSARLRLTVHATWPDDAPTRIAAALEAVCAS
jgi:8-amino-7-oxononanoate synthase